MSTTALGQDERLPLYQRLRDEMLGKIAAGEWLPGEAIPTEAELTRHYGVAVGTVRKAVETLVAEGLLLRAQGRGTFVRRPNFDGSLFRFFRQVNASGQSQVPQSRILDCRQVPADAAASQALKLSEGAPCIFLQRLRLIEPGKPNQNAYVEFFNGRLRDECLNEHWFPTLLHARTSIESWQRDYNDERPKRALGGLTPAQYAAQLAGKKDKISTGL